VAVHGPPKDDFFGENFIKQNMFAERPKNHKVPPRLQLWVGKSTLGTQAGLKRKQMTSSFDGVEISVSNFPVRIGRVPLVLAFDVGNEKVRPADIH